MSEFELAVYTPFPKSKKKKALSKAAIRGIKKEMDRLICGSGDDTVAILTIKRGKYLEDSQAIELKKWLKANRNVTSVIHVRTKEIAFKTVEDIIVRLHLVCSASDFITLEEDTDNATPEKPKAKAKRPRDSFGSLGSLDSMADEWNFQDVTGQGMTQAVGLIHEKTPQKNHK